MSLPFFCPLVNSTFSSLFSELPAPREGGDVLQHLSQHRQQPGSAGQDARGGGQGVQVSHHLKQEVLKWSPIPGVSQTN